MSSRSETRFRVAVVGATGVAGQEFLAALAGHPQFQVTHVAASARSRGKTYRDAITTESGGLSWYAADPMPEDVAKLTVQEANELDPEAVDLVFSCVDGAVARDIEARYAEKVPVISTASAFRRDEDVPLLIPGVNMEQCALLARQGEKRGWKGFVTPNPNCTTVGLATTLYPLHRAFGVKRVHMVSLQAVSGAGRSPGVVALDVVDNVIPYIPNEEGKVEWETRKVLGSLAGDSVELADIPISCTCTRVGVLEGHTLVVHVELQKNADEAALREAWAGLGKDFLGAGYYSAPEAMIHVHDDPFRPQVRLDRDRGDGLTTTVGRLRQDPHGGNGWKYMLVSHNTKMGAAKGCILLGEHLAAQGILSVR